MKTIIAYLRNERGATAVEYGLIAAGIALFVFAAIGGIGSGISTTMASVSTALK